MNTSFFRSFSRSSRTQWQRTEVGSWVGATSRSPNPFISSPAWDRAPDVQRFTAFLLYSRWLDPVRHFGGANPIFPSAWFLSSFPISTLFLPHPIFSLCHPLPCYLPFHPTFSLCQFHSSFPSILPFIVLTLPFYLILPLSPSLSSAGV